MTGLRKLQLSLLSICLATAMTDIHAGGKRGGGYIELEGFLGKATDTFFDQYPYVVSTITSITFSASPTAEQNYYFPSRSRLGYRVALGYDLPSCDCSNFGFSLEDTHYNTHINQSLSNVTSPGTAEEAVSIGALVPFAAIDSLLFGTSASVNASLNYRYNATDLMVHKNKAFCNGSNLRFLAGARYVNFREEYDALYSLPESVVLASGLAAGSFENLMVNFHDKYQGIGPILGVEGSYPLIYGLRICGAVSGDILFGYSKDSYNETDVALDATPPPFLSTGTFIADEPKTTNVVPGVTAKIGLAYHVIINKCTCSTLDIEVGYRGDKYFGIADTGAIASLFPANVNIQDATFHDYEQSGPYLEVAYHL